MGSIPADSACRVVKAGLGCIELDVECYPAHNIPFCCLYCNPHTCPYDNSTATHADLFTTLCSLNPNCRRPRHTDTRVFQVASHLQRMPALRAMLELPAE